MTSPQQTQWDFGLDEHISSERLETISAKENEDNFQAHISDETEALLQQLLSLEKEKIRLAKSKGYLTLQQLQSRVATLQQDIVALKEPKQPAKHISKPGHFINGDSLIADSSIDNEFKDVGENEKDTSVVSPRNDINQYHDSKTKKRQDKSLHRHSESSAASHIHSLAAVAAVAASPSSVPHRASSFQATNHQQFHSGFTTSPSSSFSGNHHRFTTHGSSSNTSANINNSGVTPLITMPYALNYAVTLRDKRQHATDLASTFSPEASASTPNQLRSPPSNATQSTVNNHSSEDDIGGVGSRDRRSSIHAVQARYNRSGPGNSASTAAHSIINNGRHLNPVQSYPVSSPSTTAETLLMMKNDEQSQYFSDSASDYSANSRSASVEPEHHHHLPPITHPYPNTLLHSNVNDHNATADHRHDSVSTTSSSSTSLLQDQSSFLDPDFHHIYNSPLKANSHETANNTSSSSAITSRDSGILEFCMVETDWQYLRRMHSATDSTASSASSVAAAMVSPSPGTSTATGTAVNVNINVNRTNNAAAHLKSINSFVPPSMIDRFPPNIIYDTTSHTRDIQEQSFFFPSGVHLEITSKSVRDVTTRPCYHKRHIVPFTNRDGIPLYACCLTVQQSYTLEEIYAIDPGIVAHLVNQYQAKYASICIQRAYRAFVVWKKQRAWTQQHQTQQRSANKSNINVSITAATTHSSSFFGSKTTPNSNMTARSQSVTSSSFFNHYSSSNSNSNSNHNSSNISQKKRGKGSEAGSLSGSMYGSATYSPTNAQLTQQQQPLAQHHLRSSSVYKESSTGLTTSTTTTTVSSSKSTSLFSRLFRSSSVSNAVVSQAVTAADNSTVESAGTPAPGAATTPRLTVVTSNGSTVESKQVGTMVQPVSPFSPLRESTIQSTSTSTHATVMVAMPLATSDASRLSFFNRTSTTTTTTNTTAPNTPQALNAKPLVREGKLEENADVTVVALNIAEDKRTTDSVMIGNTPVTPHQHASVRLPLDENCSFDRDDENDGDDECEEGKPNDKDMDEIENEAREDNIDVPISIPVYLSSVADSLAEKETPKELNRANIPEGPPSEAVPSVGLTLPMPTNLNATAKSTFPFNYQNYSHTHDHKKSTHYCSRFNLIHDSAFFLDKVIVGQRCYCLISPLPEYTFLFTMLDILAEAENNKLSVESSGLAAPNPGIYSNPSQSPQTLETHLASPEQRHHFLYQVEKYMQQTWARPGHVLHVQDFAFNFAVTQDLHLTGIRNRVLEKLAFRRHHNQLQSINSASSRDSTTNKKTASEESLLLSNSSITGKKKEDALYSGRDALSASAFSTSSDHLSQPILAKSTAKKYAFRVRDYVKIPQSYVDALLPTNEWALAVLITHVSASTIFKMVNLLLMEKSLIIYGQHAGVVTAITFAIAQLLSPFLWEGIFIPLVPDNAREMFGAPVPLLLGTISPPRLADVSSSTAVLHINDHMATIYYDNNPVAIAVPPLHSSNPPTSATSAVHATSTVTQDSIVPVEEKLSRIKSIDFTAWFVRLPEVTADLPIDNEIVKRMEYTRKLLGQYAKDGVHVCYPWRELVARYTVPKSKRRSSTTSYPLSNHQPGTNNNAAASGMNPSNTEDGKASLGGRKPRVQALKNETLEVHNQIDRLFLSHMPVIIRSQLRIIISVMKRYNATMCGTELFCNDPLTWKRILRLNPVTKAEEFYPDNYLEPLRSKLEFQDAMVHTQLFVSFMDRMRREAAVLDQVREFIGHWIYCRVVVKRAQQRRKDPKTRFRSFLASK